MVKLRDLLATLPSELSLNQDWRSSNHPAFDRDVTGLSTNSWTCQPGDVFIGMPGTRVDGGDFWDSALDAGAIAALVSPQVKLPDSNSACVLPMQDMNQVCAELANTFYGCPTQQLKLVGVTGTNGKTTITHLIEFLLAQGQLPTALFGTPLCPLAWSSSYRYPYHSLCRRSATAVGPGGRLGLPVWRHGSEFPCPGPEANLGL